jgi:phosphocarrier protein
VTSFVAVSRACWFAIANWTADTQVWPRKIPENRTLPRTRLTLVNPLGLHARAASKFVNLAKSFESDIRLGKDGADDANGKSIMSVMLLAAPVGSEVELSASGPDAEEAIEALSGLINEGFGELA